MPVTASRCAFIEIHLVAVGLAAELGEADPLLRYLGAIEGPADLSATVDRTVYGAGRLADTGLLIAAVNRGDRHHSWATRQIIAARRQRGKIAVPDLVVGEAFKKLRYDRRVSPRKDASFALTVFG